ncbi:hypothetical protein ACI78Q_18070, partial [Geodermatophilus sp. SYSU D00705]
MKLVTFSTGTDQRVGVVDADRGVVRDVSPLLPTGTGVLQLIERWGGGGPARAAPPPAPPPHPHHAEPLLAPMPTPRRHI